MPLDPQQDCFKPPQIPVLVHCLHCNREYDSYLIEWREEHCRDQREGFWCCPTPGCDGKGFGFDIFPVDPDYIGEDGEPLFYDDDESEDEAYDDEDDDDELDPDLEADEPWRDAGEANGDGHTSTRPRGDEQYEWDDDDIPY